MCADAGVVTAFDLEERTVAAVAADTRLHGPTWLESSGADRPRGGRNGVGDRHRLTVLGELRV